MSMHGVDIASHQAEMDCTKIKADFVIIKATQGVTYSNPCFSRHYQQAKAAGKLLGTYHYSSGGDPDCEADFYLSVVGTRVGECVLALDWEHNVPGGENPVFNTKGEVEWCWKFAERIHQRTGAWPFIYMSASVTRRRDWSHVAANCPLWLAQYGNNRLTDYQEAPWTDGAKLGAWGRNIPIHQYSPSGSIDGYRQNRTHKLDMDIAYITAEQWKACAKGDKVARAKVPLPDKTDTELAIEVWAGLHGDEQQRRKDFGYRYDSVQGEVNRLNDMHISVLLPKIMDYQEKHGQLKRA